MKKVKNIFHKIANADQCRSDDLGLCNAERQTQQVNNKKK